jgi:hypothetical protein
MRAAHVEDNVKMDVKEVRCDSGLGSTASVRDQLQALLNMVTKLWIAIC